MAYSLERKESILRKMAPPLCMSITDLSVQESISTVTLYTWRKEARSRGLVLPDYDKSADKWSSADKFNVVLKTAGLNEAELADYCREQGLYAEQIAQWKQACLSANDRVGRMDKASSQARKEDLKKITQLERDLHRKDKALSETAALLVLSKKLETVWGSSGSGEES